MNNRRLSLGLDRLSGLYIWAGFVILYSIWEPGLFPTAATAHLVSAQQSVTAMLAIAVLIPFSAGAYDISVGATVNFAAILVTSLQTAHNWNMWPAILITVAAAALIGAVNGMFVVRIGVNSFIATLGMATVVSAVQAIVSGSQQPLPPTSQSWNDLAQRDIFGFQIIFLYLIVIALLAWWMLEHTPAGRYLYAIGGNTEATRLAGVRVGRWTWLSLILSSTISGIAGVLYGSLSGPSLTFGQALLLPAFAAVFLGSTQFQPGRVNVWGTIVAVFTLATGVYGLQLVTGVQWLNDMFNGVALLLAVSFAIWRQRSTRRRRIRTNEASRHAPTAWKRPRPDAEQSPDEPSRATT